MLARSGKHMTFSDLPLLSKKFTEYRMQKIFEIYPAYKNGRTYMHAPRKSKEFQRRQLQAPDSLCKIRKFLSDIGAHLVQCDVTFLHSIWRNFRIPRNIPNDTPQSNAPVGYGLRKHFGILKNVFRLSPCLEIKCDNGTCLLLTYKPEETTLSPKIQKSPQYENTNMFSHVCN